jgi:glycosyltransferase involved in cell wall biosynthesis
VSERPVRVTYVIDKLHRAGAQVHLGQLAAGLDRRRVQAEVVCLLEGGPVADELRARGIPVEILGLGVLYAPRGLAGVARLARRLRRSRPDVLHTYLVSSNIFGAVAGRLAGVPAVVTSRRDTGFSRNRRLELFEEWLVNPLVDRVVAVSPAIADSTRRERGLRPERILTIENGVDLAALEPGLRRRDETRRSWGLSAEDAAVGVVGHLSPIKGHADFLHAAALVAAAHRRVRFFVVGDGPLRSSLEALARDLGIADRVAFMGARDDVPRQLGMLDLVVVPSHAEGMSNALLEAMAMGRPVVATAVGGNVDVVRDGVTGLLVPPREPTALAGALAELLADPTVGAALGAAARCRVRQELSLDRMLRRYEELYRSLATR